MGRVKRPKMRIETGGGKGRYKVDFVEKIGLKRRIGKRREKRRGTR